MKKTIAAAVMVFALALLALIAIYFLRQSAAGSGGN